jgi:hypothetical protein
MHIQPIQHSELPAALPGAGDVSGKGVRPSGVRRARWASSLSKLAGVLAVGAMAVAVPAVSGSDTASAGCVNVRVRGQWVYVTHYCATYYPANATAFVVNGYRYHQVCLKPAKTYVFDRSYRTFENDGSCTTRTPR